MNTCIGCNQACLDHVFVGKTASCLVNPRACHETEINVEEDSVEEGERLKIGVVGAGPAGMGFAATAATVGHSVTLFDARGEIGGQFNMAKTIPGKEEFQETIRYFGWKLDELEKKGNLQMRLGTEVSYADMEADGTIDQIAGLWRRVSIRGLLRYRVSITRTCFPTSTCSGIRSRSGRGWQ